MEDGLFPPSSMLSAPQDSTTDFDYMDELLFEGCWLETTDGSEFFTNPTPSTSTSLFDPSLGWLSSDISNGIWSPSQSQIINPEERQRSLLPGNSYVNESPGRSFVNPPSLIQNIGNVNQLGSYRAEVSQLSRTWWIGPKANPGPASSVMERLGQALGYIKEFTRDKDVLIQIWVPVNRGGRRVLTTSDQPFTLDPNCQSLSNYRKISVNYQFSAEEDCKDLVGLPGRVFLGKVPEWTPDVRFFRSEEYLRVNHAQMWDVRGTLALPVFEQGSRTCLGVIEVVTTSQMIKYRPELERVCKALEAVDLRSFEIPSIQNDKACDKSYQVALPEIRDVLRCACETHRLPLAQTWVPCVQQGKGGCRHSNENYVRCVSTVDDACYVADLSVQGFHEACSEYHLLKGQGVAGEAFLTNQPCFSADITSFKKTEYPLSHHARMFGLHGAVAIRLRGIHTGKADYVLEFFLPVDCIDPEGQRKMLSSLSIIIQKVCRSLRVVTEKELEEETCSQTNEVIIPLDNRPRREEMLQVECTHSEEYLRENSCWTACLTEVQDSGTAASLFQNEKPRRMLEEELLEVGQQQENFSLKGSFKYDVGCVFNESSFSSVTMSKGGEKRRVKAEKTITLQVLRQYFAGSLKDAAKSIGVCPTTLKRICRQHGIKRWPSRKIKKVGHSLQKIQRVIDSVQGVSGPFQIGSFYANFPELASPKASDASPFSTSKLTSNHPKPSSMMPEGRKFNSSIVASKSPSSSCSQSSSSSHSCSSGTQQQPSIFSATVTEDPIVVESLGDCVVKRVRSDAELHACSQEGPRLLPRSQSHISLGKQPNLESLLPLPKNSSQVSQEIDSQKIKVTYGDEKIRFRMQSSWSFSDLLQEIARRFNIDDVSRFDLKYLDDDSEWVLLTCDADLEECIDIYRSSQNHTIRILLQVSHSLLERSSVSSCPS